MENCSESGLKAVKGIERREFIAVGVTGAVVALAGCAEDDGDDTEGDGESSDEDDDGVAGDEGETTDEDDDDVGGDEEETTDGDAEIEFGGFSLNYEDEDSERVEYGEFTAENVGDADSGTVEVTVEWFDDSGAFLGDDPLNCWTIGEGETWIAQVTPRAAEPDEIGDFDIQTDVQTEPPVKPAGIEVVEASIDIRGEFSRYVIGTAESTADESIESVRARGKIYNSDGDIIGTATQHEYAGIPSDEDWSFELRLRDRAGARAEDAEDVEVILDTRT